MWVAWYAYMQNDVLATGILSFAMHEIVYFGRAFPWMIIDRLPYFNRYKIQSVCLCCCCLLLAVCTDRCRIKFQPCRNSGIAPNLSCSAISPLSCPRYGELVHSRTASIRRRRGRRREG